MPLIKFSSPVERISGRLGGAPNTYTYNNGAPVLRAQVGPSNPDTTDQQAIRAIFSAVTKNWKLLTQAQRNDWTTFAQTNTVTNRLGNPVGRNGLSAYVELATGHYIDTGTILSAAPVLARPSAPTSLTFGTAQVGGNSLKFHVSHAYSTLTGLYLVTRATPEIQFQSQTPKPTDYRYIQGVDTTSIIPLAASATLYSFTTTKYFYGDDNWWAGVACTIMNAEGWQSVETRMFAQFTVT